jgi:hypothetical protein
VIVIVLVALVPCGIGSWKLSVYVPGATRTVTGPETPCDPMALLRSVKLLKLVPPVGAPELRL